jgi:K+-transporting ATPase ATPase B chain
VTILLFDKTGTITHGNRHAVAFYPALGVSPTELIDGALWASMTDTTPEGRSILELVHKQHGLTPEVTNEDVVTIPFSAETRVSGATKGERAYLKGAIDTIEAYVTDLGGMIPPDVKRQANLIAQQGGTPLIVAQGAKILGTIHLKDVIKSGIRERLISLRIMGIKTMMLTGDNPLTAAAIASETGVDDFLAETTPKAKLALIRKMQKEGQVVAMIGDGTNDAPALAQADVALAMNKGTQAAKEAATMIDLESDPCKIIDVIKLGREMLMTRGALATFSYTNDLVKFFVVSGPVLAMVYPSLARFNLLHLSSGHNAVLATLIYNAIVILFLAPVAFHGVRYRVIAAELILRRNLLLFGMGGFIVPAITIKLLDMILVAMGGF